jgi:hypothetical protein
MLYSRARTGQPDDWFIIADQDELQHYPDGIHCAIDYCNRHGYDYIEGCLIDRIASDGLLPSVAGDIALADQFPLAGIVSAVLAGTCVNKIVAARGHVKLVHGQHYALSGIGCPVAHLYVQVHHFKWTAHLIPSLVARLSDQGRYSVECRRLMSYFERHERIDVTDPELLLAPCAVDYLHWPTLKQWRETAAFFSPDLAARSTERTVATPAGFLA